MIVQICLFLLVFAIMPLWKKLKIDFGTSLIISALLISFVFSVTPQQTLQNFVNVFAVYSTFKNVIIVTLIGSLGVLMKKYDFLTKVNEALLNILSGQKKVMMVLPAVTGLLSVPGGAQLSAPFVNELGENLNVKPEIRCVLNLTFRHISMFLVPTSNALIVMAAIIPDVNLYFIILLDLGFVLLMQLTSYFLYARNIKEVKTKVDKSKLPQYIKQLLVYLSPIYMIIVFNGVFGVDMLISVLSSFVIIFALCGKNDAKGYFEALKKGIKPSTFVMMVGLFFIQNTIKNADGLIVWFGDIFANSQGFVLAIAIFAFAVILSVTTGLSYTAIGVIMPMVLSLGLTQTHIAIFAFFVFASSFCGYFFSPLHLCQLLTIQTVGCPSKDVYREYAKLMPCLVVYAFALFFVYQWILL